MQFVFDDGGRAAAGFKGQAGDCVTRAIAIAAELPYQLVYDHLRAELTEYADRHHDKAARQMQRKGGRSPRNGVSKKVTRQYLESLGWRWVPTMAIGQGCITHLRADELLCDAFASCDAFDQSAAHSTKNLPSGVRGN